MICDMVGWSFYKRISTCIKFMRFRMSLFAFASMLIRREKNKIKRYTTKIHSVGWPNEFTQIQIWVEAYRWIFISATPQIKLILQTTKEGKDFCLLMMCFLERQNKYSSIASTMGHELWVCFESSPKFAYHDLKERRDESIECRTICIFHWK